LVTAVDSDSGDESMLPSPFCYELAALATDPHPDSPEPIHAPRVLAPAALVVGCVRWCAQRRMRSMTLCGRALQRNWRGSRRQASQAPTQPSGTA
jgi:hypothetical protein